METHELKILPKYFELVKKELKMFELRKNDRNYEVWDKVLLKEFENGEYTGRYMLFIITCVIKDCPEYGLMEGYCILGLGDMLGDYGRCDCEK